MDKSSICNLCDFSGTNEINQSTEDILRKFVERLTPEQLEHLKKIVSDYSRRG